MCVKHRVFLLYQKVYAIWSLQDRIFGEVEHPIITSENISEYQKPHVVTLMKLIIWTSGNATKLFLTNCMNQRLEQRFQNFSVSRTGRNFPTAGEPVPNLLSISLFNFNHLNSLNVYVFWSQ